MSDLDAHPLAPDPVSATGRIRTHLAWAVLVSALCFLPIGLVAVLYSLRASRALTAGDAERAGRLARVSRRWIIVTIVLGLLLDAALIGVFALLGASPS